MNLNLKLYLGIIDVDLFSPFVLQPGHKVYAENEKEAVQNNVPTPAEMHPQQD